MIKCELCGLRIRDGEKVLALLEVTENSHRGDFVGSASPSTGYVHFKHLRDLHRGDRPIGGTHA